MSSSVRDGIEEKLSQESNLAGCVSKLFQFVPAHLVPVDEHVVKANVRASGGASPATNSITC